jgi:pilus assembly protein CpaF
MIERQYVVLLTSLLEPADFKRMSQSIFATPPQGTNATVPSDEPRRLRHALIQRVTEALGGASPVSTPAVKAAAREHLDSAMNALNVPESSRFALAAEVFAELFGFGPIQSLLDDSTVTEIMVNRADRVYAERNGKPVRTSIVFEDNAHVMRIIERIIQPLGRRLTPAQPTVDARLPDGSRVNAVIPPVAIAGPCLTIRKFGKSQLGLGDLVRFGTLTSQIADFLRCCVVARLNMIVTGGTGSGKTTLLNVLSSCIPDEERIVTIEDAAELKLCQDHVITLEAQRPQSDGTGEVTIRELVRNALRMRPERIIVGECRGGETLDMLQAMNTGHDGSLTTLHANSPRDAISRIETMSLMAGIDFPIKVIREQIGSAVQLFIHQSRMKDGSRKVTSIVEVAGMEGDKVVLQELFKFREDGIAPDGKILGTLNGCGLRPQFMPKLEAFGVKPAMEIFQPAARKLAA